MVDPKTQKVLFARNSQNQTEIEEVAAEARKLRPMSQIFIRPPMGAELYEWPNSAD